MAMLSDHWHELRDLSTGKRVRVTQEVLDLLGQIGVWHAHHEVAAKHLPSMSEGALMGRGCFLTVLGLELCGIVFIVKGPPDAPVIHLTSKAHFLRWQEEEAAKIRKKQEEAAKGQRPKKPLPPGPAPAVAKLSRVAIIHVRWGPQTRAIASTACSLRDVAFGPARLTLPCLHCSGVDVSEADEHKVHPFLIPVRYVVGLEAGPSIDITEQMPEGGVLECFEPTQPAPAEAMTVEAIKSALAALFDPSQN